MTTDRRDNNLFMYAVQGHISKYNKSKYNGLISVMVACFLIVKQISGTLTRLPHSAGAIPTLLQHTCRGFPQLYSA